MSNRRAKVTQTEIMRTLNAAAEAGFEVGSYKVNHQTGEISVFGAKCSDPSSSSFFDEALGAA